MCYNFLESEVILSRLLRTFSNSKIYHIIYKGVNNQDIFYYNSDRKFFLEQLLINKNQFNYQIYSYCLMDNHIHLLIRIEDEFLSRAMQSLAGRYAQYFNYKYERIGPLFQNRFKSKNVENLRCFLEVCKYIHRNPENAKISKTEDYNWSSYREYIETPKLIDKEILLHYFDNNVDEFVKYTKSNESNNISDYSEFEIIRKLTDDELKEIIMNNFKIDKDEDVIKIFKGKEEEIQKKLLILKEIKSTNKTQISRVTGVSQKILKKVFD